MAIEAVFSLGTRLRNAAFAEVCTLGVSPNAPMLTLCWLDSGRNWGAIDSPRAEALRFAQRARGRDYEGSGEVDRRALGRQGQGTISIRQGHYRRDGPSV